MKWVMETRGVWLNSCSRDSKCGKSLEQNRQLSYQVLSESLVKRIWKEWGSTHIGNLNIALKSVSWEEKETLGEKRK